LDLDDLHDDLNAGGDLELPLAYIKAKSKKEVTEVGMHELTALMEKFLNFYDPQFNVGATYDVENLYRRLSLSVLFDSSFNVGSNLKAGLVVILNEDQCIFETLLKIQCGERMILVKDISMFVHMFAQSFDKLNSSYGQHMVFENLIGRIVHDVHTCAPWLVLYQIQNYYRHRIGVEEEPIRIVFSQREFRALLTFLNNQLYVIKADMGSMCTLANSLLRDILAKVRHEIKQNCKGCMENMIIHHTCADIMIFPKRAGETLLKQFAAAKADPMNSDKCRKRVLVALMSLAEPITKYLVNAVKTEASVACRFTGGAPLWIKTYVPPDTKDVHEKYSYKCGDVVDN
jgi:hypothetical protein